MPFHQLFNFVAVRAVKFPIISENYTQMAFYNFFGEQILHKINSKKKNIY